MEVGSGDQPVSGPPHQNAAFHNALHQMAPAKGTPCLAMTDWMTRTQSLICSPFGT